MIPKRLSRNFTIVPKKWTAFQALFNFESNMLESRSNDLVEISMHHVERTDFKAYLAFSSLPTTQMQRGVFSRKSKLVEIVIPIHISNKSMVYCIVYCNLKSTAMSNAI